MRRALLALLTVFAVAILAAPVSTYAQELVNRRLDPDLEWGIYSVTPDGRLASYTNWGTGQLEVLDLATGETRNLTPEADMFGQSGRTGFAEGSVFAPDGEQIAYSWFDGSCACMQLRVVGMDGSEPRVLHANPPGPSFISPMGWSPDGRSIVGVLNRGDGVTKLAEFSASDGSIRILKSNDWRSPTHARYSPDGRYIAYDFPPREDDRDRDIFLLSADGTSETTLLEGPGDDRFLDWTAAGDAVVLREDAEGTPGLWLLPIARGRAAGEPMLLKSEMWGIFGTASLTNAGSLHYVIRVGRRELFVAAFDPATGIVSSAPTPVSARYRATGGHAWSPDGKFVAFVADTGIPGDGARAQSIVIRSAASDEMRELTPDFTYINHIQWDVDGASFLASAQKQQRDGFFRVDAQTGEATQLLAGVLPISPQLSSDGKTVYYSCRRCPQSGLYAMNLESGEERGLLRRAGDGAEERFQRSTQALALSPDERELAAISYQSDAISVVPTGGGLLREVYRIEKEGNFGGISSIEWSADGRYILFTLVDASRSVWESSIDLWRLSPATGVAERVAGLPMNAARFHLHPDGRRISFVAGQERIEAWVLDNLVPGLKAAADSGHR